MTGAGKSSMVAALLRLTEIEGGTILVDGHDIGAVPLRRLRSGIACVPQTPFLFQVCLLGTLRATDDPLPLDGKDGMRTCNRMSLGILGNSVFGVEILHAMSVLEVPADANAGCLLQDFHCAKLSLVLST